MNKPLIPEKGNITLEGLKMNFKVGDLIRVTYNRAKNKDHNHVGCIKEMHKNKMIISLEDGQLVRVLYSKIINEVKHLQLEDIEMKERISLLSGLTVLLEYKDNDGLHRSTGEITRWCGHIFYFQSINQDEVIDIHYDDVIQVEAAIVQPDLNVKAD